MELNKSINSLKNTISSKSNKSDVINIQLS